MWLFNDPLDYPLTDEIEDRAMGGGSTGLPLALTVILGAVGWGLGGPIAGVGMAIAASGQLFKGLGDNSKTVRFTARNPGVIAHRITSEADMCAWIEAHGPEKVAEQIELAGRSGQTLTGLAKRTYRHIKGDTKYPLPNARVQDRLPSRQPTEQTNPNKAERNQPRSRMSWVSDPVHTVDTTAAPSDSIDDRPTTQQSPHQPTTKNTVSDNQPTTELNTAYELMLADPYQSRAFFGAQRTGKTYLAACVARALPETNVYHINLASVGTADETYWGWATSVRGDLAKLTPDEGQPLIEQARKLIDAYMKDESPSLLVIDEFAITGSKYVHHSANLYPLLEQVATIVSALSSSGKQRRKAVWTIAPEMVASTLEDLAKAIKRLRLCYVTIAPGKSVQWERQRIVFDDELFDQVRRNYSISKPRGYYEGDRIVYLNGQWLEVGELPPIQMTSTDTVTPGTSQSPDPTQPQESIEPDPGDETLQRDEIRRYLSLCDSGAKPRDLASRARVPIRGMTTEDIRIILDVMVLEGDVWVDDGHRYHLI